MIASTAAMMAPRPPLIATATAGVIVLDEAAAPVRTIHRPGVTCMPPLARPKAWPRRCEGTAATKAALAASW